jgi:predicted nucleic acid-binding protein
VASVILVDTSALVALWSPSQRHYAWARAQWERMRPPLLTCEAVLTETAYLLSRYPQRLASMFEVWRRGLLRLDFSAQHQREALRTLTQRYSDVPISFADACLVRMSELHADCRIWTLDSDFKIYRRNGRQTIPLLLPDGRGY